jgi:hypothetical protein
MIFSIDTDGLAGAPCAFRSERHMMAESCTKADLINHLAAVHGYRRYLELCSSTTGFQFAQIDRSKLDCHRLMYRCPDQFSDGLEIDFRSSDLDITECLREIGQRQLCYDVMLVDPFHEYEASLRDIAAAFDLVVPGGTIVVHDCLPPSEDLAVSQFIAGPWCGVTYKAYLDFVTARDDLAYYTVDTDFGCGVIRKLSGDLHSPMPPATPEHRDLIERWQRMGNDFEAAFRFFQQNQRSLLKLRTIDEFFQAETDA